MTGYIADIEEKTLSNTYFRQILYTGQHSQLVLMCLQPNEDIGEEVHEIVDQFFRVEEGEGKVIIDGVEQPINDGTAVIVPAGSKHNLVNVSSEKQLKVYTIYSPAHHKDGVIHKTKEEAEADTADHI